MSITAAVILGVVAWFGILAYVAIALCANHDPDQARREGRLW